MIQPEEVVRFWAEAGPERWFNADVSFDALVMRRFFELHHDAARLDLHHWGETPEGALALILLLDQIPRNLFRGSAHAYATDGLARQVAAAAIERGFDQQIALPLRLFMYLPFEHAESPTDQARAVALIEALGNPDWTRYAKAHQEVIGRFGRFPHRNAALGRRSSASEQAFLAEGGGFG